MKYPNMSDSTDTITIRVPKLLKNKLEETSEKNKVTLNLLVNQILNKNMQWDEHITKMGYLQFNPSTVREIFNVLNEDKISELAKLTRSDMINGVKFIFGDASIEHVIEFIDMWLRSTNTPFRHTEDSKYHKFMVNHTIGKNWSIFAIKITEECFTELGYKIMEKQISNDFYSFTISK